MGGFKMLSFLSKTLFENDHIFTYSSLIFKEIQQDLELCVFWFLKKCLLFQKPCIMRLAKTPKIRTFAKLLVKIRVHITSVYGSNSKPRICKVRTPRGRVSQGLAVIVIKEKFKISRQYLTKLNLQRVH